MFGTLVKTVAIMAAGAVVFVATMHMNDTKLIDQIDEELDLLAATTKQKGGNVKDVLEEHIAVNQVQWIARMGLVANMEDFYKVIRKDRT